MKFSVKGMGLAMGLGWGGVIFVTALANFFWPTYGTAFLKAMDSVYPRLPCGDGVGKRLRGGGLCAL